MRAKTCFDVVRPGYVQPSPVHLKTSTVREEFEFASALRTPRNVSAKLRQDLIRDLITSLDWSPKPTRAGQVVVRGGDEALGDWRGVALVAQPHACGPALGGDRRKDWETMEILQTLAKLGVCQSWSRSRPRCQRFSARVGTLPARERGGHYHVGWQRQGRGAVLASTGRVNHERFGDGDFLLLCSEFAKETWPSAHGDVEAKPGKLKHARIPQPLASSGTQFAWLLRRELRQVGLRPYNIGSDLGPLFPILIDALARPCLWRLAILFGFKQVVLREQSGATYWLGWAFASKMVTELVINFTCWPCWWACATSHWLERGVRAAVDWLLCRCRSCCSYAYFFRASR
ncbi:hypothetical protein BASA82_000297 [Batrachochytrium salamandrivorans]|nr:hypothetical protein BASA82_000297 [Batrachochytrium salamandrivorans]